MNKKTHLPRELSIHFFGNTTLAKSFGVPMLMGLASLHEIDSRPRCRPYSAILKKLVYPDFLDPDVRFVPKKELLVYLTGRRHCSILNAAFV
jgi:hypothetical protein